jgi:hypothetical protein
MLYILHMYLKCWNLQLSLQSWTGELSESFVAKRHAHNAFKSKDFATAVQCYSKGALYYVMETYKSPICTFGPILELMCLLHYYF